VAVAGGRVAQASRRAERAGLRPRAAAPARSRIRDAEERANLTQLEVRLARGPALSRLDGSTSPGDTRRGAP
jgi:hypothetical protein